MTSNTAIQLTLLDNTNNNTSPTPNNITPISPKKSRPTHTKYPQQRVSPIRNPEKVNQIYNALLSSGKYGLRNATIFALQLAIGRRTNDIAKMTLKDICTFNSNGEITQIKSRITVDEHKTGKTARDLPLSTRTRHRLLEYINTLSQKTPTSLLFPSRKHNPDGSQRHLDTASLDHIYKKYTAACFSEEDEQTHISTYAARKTYGYNIYSECIQKHNGLLPGTDINALQYVQSVFNHESTSITLRYIGAYDAPAGKLAEDIESKYNF